MNRNPEFSQQPVTWPEEDLQCAARVDVARRNRRRGEDTAPYPWGAWLRWGRVSLRRAPQRAGPLSCADRSGRVGWRLSFFIGLVGAVWALTGLGAAEPAPPADDWFTNGAVFPRSVDPARVLTNDFLGLHADFLAGRLKIRWEPSRLDTNWTVLVQASADAPGHWPARDWRPYAMARRETMWETAVPVDHPAVPILYFVQVENPALPGPRFSPMRICHPRRLGIEEPTRIFWPFLEGFEEGLASWELMSKGGQIPPLTLSPMAKNGHAALLVTVPAGKRSATVTTMRVRGWQVRQHQATGVSVWLRAMDGPAQARFTLLSHAYSTNQVVAPCSREASLNDTWQRVDLRFEEFPGAALSTLDLFTIEFIAIGPSRFLVDDLQLLGGWPLQ